MKSYLTTCWEWWTDVNGAPRFGELWLLLLPSGERQFLGPVERFTEAEILEKHGAGRNIRRLPA